MKFQLESLPTTILIEVFSYTDPEELLDFRFLNKSFFNITRGVIKEHLRYSTYKNSNSFKVIQFDFIKNNSTYVMHLNINLYITSRNLAVNEIYNTTNANKFKNVKSLDLFINAFNPLLREKGVIGGIKEILFKTKKVALHIANNGIIAKLISSLNPKILKSLSIYNTRGTLIINDILRFKELEKLEELEIVTHNLVVKSYHLINSNRVIFPILKILGIKVLGKIEMDYNIFNNADQLETITFELREYNDKVLNFIKSKNPLTKVLIYHTGNCSITDLPASLRQVNSMSVLNVNIIITYKKVFSHNWEDHSIEMSTFSFVNEIIFINCMIEISFLSETLKYFPNIMKVRFKNSPIYCGADEILVLPKNSNPLFCIESNSSFFINNSDLFNSINAYVY